MEVSAIAAAISCPIPGRSGFTPSAEISKPIETHQNKCAAENEDEESPQSPLEDPDLVGPEAAARARERRIYMARCNNDAEALKQENKSWDFMLAQMGDWKEREKSWEQFRREVSRGGVLGRRIGLGGRGSLF